MSSTPSGVRPGNDGANCTGSRADGWYAGQKACWLGSPVWNPGNPTAFAWELLLTLQQGQERCAHLEAIYAVDDTGSFSANGGAKQSNPGNAHYLNPRPVPQIYGGWRVGTNRLRIDLVNTKPNPENTGPWGIYVEGSVCFTCDVPTLVPSFSPTAPTTLGTFRPAKQASYIDPDPLTFRTPNNSAYSPAHSSMLFRRVGGLGRLQCDMWWRQPAEVTWRKCGTLPVGHRNRDRPARRELPCEQLRMSLICDPPTCCVCGTKMPSDLRNGTVRSKDRLFVYRETALPVTLVDGAAVSLTEPGVYNEVANTTWSSQATMSTLPAGTKVLSYFVHVDSEGETSKCKMKFSTEVLGFQGMVVRASQDAMDASHALFSPGTRFCTRAGSGGCSRAMENADDGVTIGSDRMEVSVTSRSLRGYVDQLRVLVKPKELPVGLTACPKGCGKTACPVDCLVDIWQAWSACSVTCGSGTRQRNRWVLDAGQGGAACPALTETSACSKVCTEPPLPDPLCTRAPRPVTPTPVLTSMPSFQCLPTLAPAPLSSHPSLSPSLLPSRTPSFRGRRLLAAMEPVQLPAVSAQKWPVPQPMPHTLSTRVSHSRRLLASCTPQQTAPRCLDIKCEPASCCSCGNLPPASLKTGKVRSTTHSFVYRERTQVTLTKDQPVTILGSKPGSYDQIPKGNMYGAMYIRKGTTVVPFIVHGDSANAQVTCKITFATEILGVIVGSNKKDSAPLKMLVESDKVFGNPGTDYCSCTQEKGAGCSKAEHCARQMELHGGNKAHQDYFKLDHNRRTITFRTNSSPKWIDEARILVKPFTYAQAQNAGACPTQPVRTPAPVGQCGNAADARCSKSSLCTCPSGYVKNTISSCSGRKGYQCNLPLCGTSGACNWGPCRCASGYIKFTISNCSGRRGYQCRLPTKAPTLRPSRRPTATPTYRPSNTRAPTRPPIGPCGNAADARCSKASSCACPSGYVKNTIWNCSGGKGYQCNLPLCGTSGACNWGPCRCASGYIKFTLSNCSGRQGYQCKRPTTAPTLRPTPRPTPRPTHRPTAKTRTPTRLPTRATPRPTRRPTDVPTTLPPTTDRPSYRPTRTPTHVPTSTPTIAITMLPCTVPGLIECPQSPCPSALVDDNYHNRGNLLPGANPDCCHVAPCEFWKIPGSSTTIPDWLLGRQTPVGRKATQAGVACVSSTYMTFGNVWQESAQGTDLAPGEWDGSGDTSFSQCKAKAESSVHSVHAFTVASLARSEQCTLGMRIMHSCRV